ncbi:MAG: YkgJ family cysteine cluster protein [Mariniphaga sp.]|nr:YkgJ family cysteine cluster protein [Mariniphaga sp.]
MEKHFSAYRKIRKETDVISKKLSKVHSSHLQCKKGCDLCCMDYSILPVEFYSILEDLKSRGFKAENLQRIAKNDEDCIFLKNHDCTIYESRPLICRTHGQPLLYTNDDGEWELSTCELNFKDYDFENFSEENTFPQDKFNSKLFLINREFIAEFKEETHLGEFELLPLKKLGEKL